MGILTRFTLRSLARNRARTIATVIGIALSCALITAIFTSVTSIGGGLLQREVQYDGTWQVASPRVSDHKLSELRANSHVTELAAARELGSAKPSDQVATKTGALITVKSLPSMLKGTGSAWGTEATEDVGLAQVSAITSGRMPQNPSEIVLPRVLEGVTPDGAGISGTGPLAIGSSVTLELGDRVHTAGDGTRTRLSAIDAYASEENGYEDGSEKLENMRSRTFTVVGFIGFIMNHWAYSGALDSSAAGSVALVGPMSEDTANGDAAGNDLANDGFAAPYLATDFKSYRELDEWSALLFSTGVDYAKSGLGGNTLAASGVETGGYVLHNGLLRYQGLTDERAIWNTLWQLATILTVVVMVASVSLIYTSFAISVTERMRQFGLLSGVGASKRQLRHTVVAEALALGVVGIPMGVFAGIAGTAATLRVTQRGFAALLGTEGTLDLLVDPRAVTLACALSLVTLLVSAWIPAARAGRVSAVDAIRQTSSVREGRLARLCRRRGAGLGSHLAQLAFGVPGLVAHRNLTRSSSRGRIVVASLAVSVALVVTCGVLDTYMRPVAGLSGSTTERALEADVSLSASVDDSAARGGRGAEAAGGEATGANGSSDSEALSSSPTFADRFQRLVADASAPNGTSSRGSYLSGSARAIVPASMLDANAIATMKEVAGFDLEWTTETGSSRYGASGPGAADNMLSPYAASGDYTGMVNVYYLDDASWAAYVAELGLDASQFTDPAHPRAIGLNLYKSDNGQRYLDLVPYTQAGTLKAYAPYAPTGTGDLTGYSYLGIYEDADGKPVARWGRIAEDGYDLARDEGGAYDLARDESGAYDLRDVPAEQACAASQDIEVAALADHVPNVLLSSGAVGSFPAVVMPMSALADTEAGTGGTVSVAHGQAFLASDDPDATEKRTDALLKAESAGDAGAISGTVYNIAADRQAHIDTTQLVQLFVALFSVITMLIALANVFNTLTNSIILRTREFAVLRSVGMGERAFGRMIAYECASYAWRGLAIGLALAMLVSWAMWRAMQDSFIDLGFAVPWGYIGIAAAGTLVVLALSVAYALRRTRAQNLVEALRQDAL